MKERLYRARILLIPGLGEIQEPNRIFTKFQPLPPAARELHLC